MSDAELLFEQWKKNFYSLHKEILKETDLNDLIADNDWHELENGIQYNCIHNNGNLYILLTGKNSSTNSSYISLNKSITNVGENPVEIIEEGDVIFLKPQESVLVEKNKLNRIRFLEATKVLIVLFNYANRESSSNPA